jgi:hypothetical protein
VDETWPRRLNFEISKGCQYHLLPELWGAQESICVNCIKMHLKIRFQDYGLQGANCAAQGCSHHNSETSDWRFHALFFLPQVLHESFYQQSLQIFLDRTEIWKCPTGCASHGMTMEPKRTPGFPHVECPSCTGRFCACCKVTWHEGLTCQQYNSAHPELLDEEEVVTLESMA